MIVLGLTPEPERSGRLSSVGERCTIFLLHVVKENPFGGDGALEKKRERISLAQEIQSQKGKQPDCQPEKNSILRVNQRCITSQKVSVLNVDEKTCIDKIRVFIF
jgi:hypothetical protein